MCGSLEFHIIRVVETECLPDPRVFMIYVPTAREGCTAPTYYAIAREDSAILTPEGYSSVWDALHHMDIYLSVGVAIPEKGWNRIYPTVG